MSFLVYKWAFKLYNNYTTSLEEYIEKVNEVPGDLGEFERVEQPVYILCPAIKA
ncbi:MAG: hypothetical protein QJR05_08725 [Thermoanaerobacterium sp.]|nr:hypothetical protein [Thermoanaerobacterium sp.]